MKKLLAKNSHIFIALSIIALFTFKFTSNLRSYEMKTPYQFRNDVDQYYSFLPAAFIHDDLSFSYPNGYWLIDNQNGKKLPKVTMGMSYMYAPFFFIGHAVALNTKYKANGYSKPYSIAIWFGTIIYFLIGVFFLIKALDIFFNKWISFSVALLLFFGTNLLIYTIDLGEMPHSYLFALFSICIYLTIKWHRTQQKKHFFLLAFVFGLCVIIRPVEIIFALFFLLYGVYNKESFLNKLTMLRKHYWQIIVGAFVFLIPIIPQLIYWKVYGGDWLVYSYGSEEKFFFNDPKIVDFLIGYRKGWFVYTPLMVFSIIGMFFLKKKVKEMTLVIPLFIGFIIFLLSSWWCWWYGGSFGMRAMIQYYAFLAFPLAAFISFIVKKRVLFLSISPIILFFVYFSLLYSYKYNHFSLHWDSMTKEAYWYTFMKPKVTSEDINNIEKLLEAPNYEEARKGNR